MPDVVRVLASGSSSPTDFTLHDADHSRRVAEWMVKLVPEGMLEAFSEYELALLLLAAYLHDIGMTPEVEKVRRHREFLLDGPPGVLTVNELAGIQGWLDSAGYGATPPSSGARAGNQAVGLVEEILTYYTRHRHNDWSEEWIRKHFTGEALGTYEGWMTDLVRLCRSHHDGYEVLTRREFDPRRVGSEAKVVHLRYLSALLRIADILDVDRERTPSVIFQHRDVAPASAKYWEKDAQLTIHLEDGKLSVYARPPRAYLHRAVEETIDAIERELALCRRLADTTPFEKLAGQGKDLPHRWMQQSSVFRDVEPQDGAYQYIDGSFRPNTRRLLDLLSGTALYGDALAAVRELLQNAFDAVRELVAYRRLQQPDPADPTLEAQFGKLLRVRLSLEQDGNRLWLICHDPGIGMTRDIIRDTLLVSGSPVRPEIMALERRCRDAGFALGRTGQFGIGALSYFMLADQVVLTTRRANEAGYAEPNGWRFESSGIGSFGELRADSTLTNGTEIRMRLRSDVSEAPAELAARLSSYIQASLLRIPCNFAFDAPATPDVSFALAPGWTLDETERQAWTLEQLRPSGEETGYGVPEVPSPSYLHRIGRHAARWSRIRRYAETGLRWAVDCGDLPDGAGRYRLHLPYLDVPGGAALAVVRPREAADGLVLRPVAEGHYTSLSTFTRWAWKGIAIRVATKPPSGTEEEIVGPFGVLVPARALLGMDNPVSGMWERYGVSAEVDFWSPDAGELSVSRGRLDLSSAGVNAVDWLGGRARALVEAFVSDNRASTFTLLNAHVSGVTPPDGVRYEWALSTGGRALLRQGERRRAVRWGQLRFPVADVIQEPVPLAWAGQSVSGAVELKKHGYAWSGQTITWYDPETPPQRVVAMEIPGYGPIPVALWTEPPVPSVPTFRDGWKSEFPPEWRHVCGATLGGRWGETRVWNLGNPVVRAVSSPHSMSGANVPRPGATGAPETIPEEVFTNQATAAAWVLDTISSPGSNLWDTLQRGPRNLLPRLFSVLFGSERDATGEWHSITFYRATDRPELVVLSPAGIKIVESSKLPFPAGAEWCVT